jgi:prolipoprotein diacylglyceryl transferase
MFVHRIDPVIAEVRGVYLWWYGLSYALGFLELHVWFRLQSRRLAMTMREVYDISILVPLCVLAGGHLVEVFFYEWPYYRVHPGWIPALWIGGMSTHGLLAGAAVGTAIFCALHKRSFILMADELVIPGAFLMGIGRIGNFIDGQIVGSMTTMPWGVAAGSEWLRVAAFAAIVLFCLTIPSDWTQDLPKRYGKRHPGLHHSALYPPVVVTVMPIIVSEASVGQRGNQGLITVGGTSM